MDDKLPAEPHVVVIEDHGPRPTDAQHRKMERLEGELVQHETEVREIAEKEKAGQADPPKGWMDPQKVP